MWQQWLDWFGTTAGISTWIVAYIVFALGLMRVAQRAHDDSPWMAWVPLLNLILMIRIAKAPILLLILCLIPCTSPIGFVIVWWSIAQQLGRSPLPSLLCLSGFLTPLVPWFYASKD